MTTRDVVPRRTLYILCAIFTVGLMVVGWTAMRAMRTADTAATEARCRSANDFRDFVQGQNEQAITEQVKVVDTLRSDSGFIPERVEGWVLLSPETQSFVIHLAEENAAARAAAETAAILELRQMRQEAYDYMLRFPLQDCNGDGTIDEDEFPPTGNAPVVPPPLESVPTASTTGES